MASSLPSTLGALRQAVDCRTIPRRSVRSEMRDNLMARLRAGGPLFPGIVGYDDTVMPQVVNAILSRHNFILLGLRGQAKTRLLRALTTLLDERIPVVAGLGDQRQPARAALRRRQGARAPRQATTCRSRWLPRDARYVEKLATPDVTIADMVGDIDPIKAARSGLQLGDELTMHYGLLPRANRGIFAINELPDLAGSIQVGLFNILQEGDVQIKGYPVRLPLDLMIVFTANPEDYTARGKIITPLKDRIGSEIRTHYPASRATAMAITEQEAWASAAGCRLQMSGLRARSGRGGRVPGAQRPEDRQALGRQPAPADQLLENVVSNAERRALVAGRDGRRAAHRRHLRGAAVDHRQVRAGIRRRAARRRHGRARSDPRGGPQRLDRLFPRRRRAQVVKWFEMRRLAADERRHRGQGPARRSARGPGPARARAQASARSARAERALASAVDFALEGLCAQKKISRTDEWRYSAGETAAAGQQRRERGRRGSRKSLEDDDVSSSGAGEEEVLQLRRVEAPRSRSWCLDVEP